MHPGLRRSFADRTTLQQRGHSFCELTALYDSNTLLGRVSSGYRLAQLIQGDF